MDSAVTADRGSEAEIQALIAHLEIEQPIETPNNIGYTFYPQDLTQAACYFRRALVDWSAAYPQLVAQSLLAPQGDGYALTAHGACAADCVLDLGCGNGGIAAYLAEASGAHVVGMDYIPEAIRQAQRRAARDPRLAFAVGNLDALPFAPQSFDAIVAVDSLYMPNDLVATARQMGALLRPGGRMGLFSSFALWEDPAATPEHLCADRTPLGAALRATELPFQALDFT